MGIDSIADALRQNCPWASSVLSMPIGNKIPPDKYIKISLFQKRNTAKYK